MTEGERRTWRQIVDASYSDEVERFYEQHQSLLDESLDPRGPALFFDLAAEWGLDASSHALDVGSRDGRHLASVSSRFGCRVTRVEPAEGNLARMGHQPALARAVENATTIVVADIAGRQGGRSALGSSLIVDPDGVVLAGAEPDGEALLVAEVEAARRAIGPRGRDGHRNPAVTEAFTALWRPDAV